jgi:hypothetical protein
MSKFVIAGFICLCAHFALAEDHEKKRSDNVILHPGRPVESSLSNGKTTESGHKFFNVSAEELIKDHQMNAEQAKKFVGDGAFKDESGTIWGDLAKDTRGKPLVMTHNEAKAYCKSLGATLPSGYPEYQNKKNGNQDSDFVRLRKAMGAESLTENYDGEYFTEPCPKNFKPQILPNMRERDPNPWLWSSSFRPYVFFADDVFVFNTGYGNLSTDGRFNDGIGNYVRCVVHPRF